MASNSECYSVKFLTSTSNLVTGMSNSFTIVLAGDASVNNVSSEWREGTISFGISK